MLCVLYCVLYLTVPHVGQALAALEQQTQVGACSMLSVSQTGSAGSGHRRPDGKHTHTEGRDILTALSKHT